MSPDVWEILAGGRQRHDGIAGVVTAVVDDTQDPEGLGRVALRFPWLDEGFVISWARVALAGAGQGRGTFWVPEAGDEVVVAFEHGDPRLPYVLGGLYSSDAKPAETGDGATARRSLTSTSGHVIRLDDGDDAPKIEIVDQSGDNRIVITSSDDGIEIHAKGDVKITSDSGKVSISGSEVEITADSKVTVSSQGDLDLEASGSATLRGATVAIN